MKLKISELTVNHRYFEHKEGAWVITTDGKTVTRYSTPSELERDHGVQSTYTDIWEIDD